MLRFLPIKSDFLMIINIILVFGYINIITSESLSSQTWSNIIQDLSLKAHNDKNIETHPLNEGFILFSDSSKKPSPTTKSARLSLDKRISKFHNISSTTCRTVVILKTTKSTSPPIIDHSVGHLGRRLLNEPSDDLDLDTTSTPPPSVEDDSEMNNFLKVDDEELNKRLSLSDAMMDGSGETEETTTVPPVDTPDEYPTLSNNSKFIVTLNCSNANATLTEILNDLKAKFGSDLLKHDINELDSNCKGSDRGNLTLEFITNNNTGSLTNLFGNLTEIALSKGLEVYSDNKCENSGIVRMTNFTSCFLFDLCKLCGTNPERGRCIPQYKEPKCECYKENRNDSSKPYTGEFCWPESQLVKPLSVPSRWTPVIVGILAGLTGLCCAITCCLWVIAAWRRGKHHNKYDLRVHRLWHLPRAQVPTSVTSENVQTYLDNTISTLSSDRTDPDVDRSNITDSTFFKELDQRMGENLRATITRPNTSAMLASLPSDTTSTLSTYDPIDELDAIIDNEDVNMTFHDPLSDFPDDNDMLEVINPNLKLPRPNIDSKPTGLFSYFYNDS